MTDAPGAGLLGARAARAFRGALAKLDPAMLVRDALPPLPPRRARVRIIAIGKAAHAMTRGAFERWGTTVDDALVVTAEAPALGLPATTRREVWLQAPHPLPDERSVAAAELALERATALGSADLLLALVSGGASSVLAAPPAFMPLAEKAALVARLLDAGASIRDVNTVRRHLSRVKGGRLAEAAAPARVLTLIMGDVVGGEPHDVGSGPTVADPTTVDDARAVLRRHGEDANVERWLSESLKPDAAVRTRARMIADPTSLANAVARELLDDGFRVTVDPPEEGDAGAIVARRIARAATLGGREAVVIACEPTLRLPEARGNGGRAGWTALAAMRRLPPGVAFLCGASDGVDGSSGAAGAVVTREVGTDDEAIDHALAAFDDASVHRAMGTHLAGGATGQNLCDVHVLLRDA